MQVSSIADWLESAPGIYKGGPPTKNPTLPPASSQQPFLFRAILASCDPTLLNFGWQSVRTRLIVINETSSLSASEFLSLWLLSYLLNRSVIAQSPLRGLCLCRLRSDDEPGQPAADDTKSCLALIAVIASEMSATKSMMTWQNSTCSTHRFAAIVSTYSSRG